MKDSEIISFAFVAIGVISLAVVLMGRHNEKEICENIRAKEDGSVYCWRCKTREVIKSVRLGVDGKTPNGTTFRFANIYTYGHDDPFEAYTELDGKKIKKLQVGKFPGATYSATEDE